MTVSDQVRRAVPAARARLGRGRQLATASAQLCRDPELARDHLHLRQLSKQAFEGWATSHLPRWWEYPWIVREVRRRGSGGRAADFGAGKSPVPLALAELGYRTYVVDPDTLGGKYGNEWDFVDYGPWGIETIRAGMEDEVFDAGSLDVAVSVSVIEHLPAAARREGLRQIFAALRPGGLAVLSVDLIPGAESYLWNLIVDEVEPLRRHGTFDDLKSECRQAGFVIAQVERCPISLPELRVEALILHRP